MTVDRLHLSSAVDLFLAARRTDGYAPGTLVQYEWALTRLVEFTGDKPVNEITAADLQRCLAYLREDYQPSRPGGSRRPLSGSSLFAAWKAFRAFYLWAHDEFQLPRIALQVSRPRFAAPEIIPFTGEEIRRLIRASEVTREAAPETRRAFSMRRPTAVRDRALILLLLDTGIRVSESARLRVGDVNLISGEIHVTPFRSGLKSRPRTIPIGAQTVKTLGRYLSLRGKYKYPDNNDLVFQTAAGLAMNKDSIRQVLHEIGERAGVANVHPHRFRHTFAIMFLKNDGDIFSLQKLLGHSSLEMVKHYLYIAQADLVTAHRRASPVDNLRL